MSGTGRRGLSANQLEAFERDGFVVVDGLLNDRDLVPIYDEYELILEDQIGRMLAAGALRQRPVGTFGDRYAAVITADPQAHRRFNISLPLINGPVDADSYLMHCGPAVFDLLRHPSILDAVESVIGPEIASNPVQQMRMKPAEAQVVDETLRRHSNVGATTWHQDIVALLPDADDSQIVTVWVALTDALIENGCLVSIPGSHRLGPQVHCANQELASEPYVPPAVLSELKERPLPVRRGGIVLFDKLNVHRALPNRSKSMRWSADLRYNPIGQGTGRPAFPTFAARSARTPGLVLTEFEVWKDRWDAAREAIVSRTYTDRVFEDVRWNDEVVC
ncbi:MAG: phytanoyl-CoA dioxygenase family protein [Acidimicrobiaceae bacterium]|nr:phytanoyl-CoA dioxygenase family protein [Acidimicrobiaceae bacterium]